MEKMSLKYFFCINKWAVVTHRSYKTSSLQDKSVLWLDGGGDAMFFSGNQREKCNNHFWQQTNAERRILINVAGQDFTRMTVHSLQLVQLHFVEIIEMWLLVCEKLSKKNADRASIFIPGAVERTGGICPLDRKLRSCDCLTGEILETGETHMHLFVECKQ